GSASPVVTRTRRGTFSAENTTWSGRSPDSPPKHPMTAPYTIPPATTTASPDPVETPGVPAAPRNTRSTTRYARVLGSAAEQPAEGLKHRPEERRLPRAQPREREHRRADERPQHPAHLGPDQGEHDQPDPEHRPHVRVQDGRFGDQLQFQRGRGLARTFRGGR